MLKRFFGGSVASETPPSTPATAASPAGSMTPAEKAAGVNIRTAIDAHIKWRHRLEDYVRGTSTEKLQVDIVSADHNCVLGKWIHGDGMKKYGHFDLFTELVSVHAKFHEHAGCVLQTAQQGNPQDALALLQSGGYPRTSAKVKHLLAKLYVEVLCEEHPVHGHTEPHPPAIHQR